MPKKDLIVYTEKDFKKATSRIERMYMYMLQPNKFYLNDQDFRHFEMIKRVFVILDDSLTKIQAAKKVMETEIDVETMYKAMSVINDAEALLGPLLKRNKDFVRAVVVEKARKLFEMAMTKGWGKTAAMALNIIVKAEGLDRPDTVSNIIEDLTLPDIGFTDDPKALIAEDMDYEEEE